MSLPAQPEILARRLTTAPVGAVEPSAIDALADPAQQSSAATFALLPVRRLLAGALAGSPYLTQLMRRDPARLLRVLTTVPEHRLASLELEAAHVARTATTQAQVMAGLRAVKAEAALLIALADLGGAFDVAAVTAGLTQIADACLHAAVGFLFARARERGDWLAGTPDGPERGSGYIVIAMGKYGAGELNYSSDIDLVVFYDAACARVREGLDAASFFVRITRGLVSILQERTGDGYVFRVDLRLRPDPGATQIALSTDAALHYYESVGQNWERAAMIKARAAAGDREAGVAFLAELSPFVWRRYLDFAAIADIHAMKRQINAHRGFSRIGVAGHNIKVGRGGIREIEFFAQTQQLIAGGRQPDLRTPRTVEALQALARRGWIAADVADELTQAYARLRTIEHRLQMIDDEQTHTLPQEDEALIRLARFAGYGGTAGNLALPGAPADAMLELSRPLLATLETVVRHYAALFENQPALSRTGGNMVFAGAADDPATIAALAKLGFSRPVQVIATVRAWHHGRYPAVRSAQARERLTQVQPLLMEALSETADPDAAIASFDRFLSALPAGVQLFSLLHANPKLLRLVADVLGTAPRLAHGLARRPRVLDAVLDPRVMDTLPSRLDLASLIATELSAARDVEDVLDRARVVGHEQSFLVGVRIMSGMIRAEQAGGAYALLAETLIEAVQTAIEADFARTHGQVAGGGAAVVAMGKLGGREMTASSDLDVIVVYDHDPAASYSDGPRPLAVSQYYARLTQRLIAGLAAPTAEGRLYEVDLRLRPSGNKGPVATQLSSFVSYQANDAWTWEQMALTRARVISGPPMLRAKVERAIRHALRQPRDRTAIAADVRDMRRRIADTKGTTNVWDLKQVRGGLVDLEFIAQFLQLAHASTHPGVLDQSTVEALRKLAAAGLLAAAHGDVLIRAARLLNDLTQILRLSLDSAFDPATAPKGLTALLASVADVATMDMLDATLRETLTETSALFDVLVS